MTVGSNARGLASVVMLLVFATQALTPRAIVVRHQHAGGEHAHVHADEVDALINEWSTPRQRHAAEQALWQAPVTANGLVFSLRAHDSFHSHWQQSFHGADSSPTPPLLLIGASAESVVRAVVRNPLWQHVFTTHVRGPPRSLRV